MDLVYWCILLFSLFSILWILLNAFVLEHIFFEVKEYQIGKKESFQHSIRILHISDLHFRTRLGWKYRKLIKKINQLNVDIIFISGDSIDQNGNINPFEKFMRLLSAEIPKVGILGNHEYKANLNINQLGETYLITNGKLLINESTFYLINDVNICVTGFDDLLEGTVNIKKAVDGLKKQEHHFGLIHSPKHQELIKNELLVLNQDKVLEDQVHFYAFFAGHNHGGQVKIGDYVPVLPPKSGDYVEGWYNSQQPYLYLSKGFGTSRIPIRFGSRSEITIFTYNV